MTSKRVLLPDTHVWLWLAFGAPGKIPPHVVSEFDESNASSPLWISIISVWEVALLESEGRLRLPMSVEAWMREALSPPTLRLLELDAPQAVIDSCNLPGQFHADPADRLLVASARHLDAHLVTHDQKIIDYGKAGYVQVLPV
jgi:PIN domain nuclease of toxin-antitoxin system